MNITFPRTTCLAESKYSGTIQSDSLNQQLTFSWKNCSGVRYLDTHASAMSPSSYRAWFHPTAANFRWTISLPTLELFVQSPCPSSPSGPFPPTSALVFCSGSSTSPLSEPYVVIWWEITERVNSSMQCFRPCSANGISPQPCCCPYGCSRLVGPC